jgi:hypothetical protein
VEKFYLFLLVLTQQNSHVRAIPLIHSVMVNPRKEVISTEQILEKLWEEEELDDVRLGEESDLESDQGEEGQQEDLVYEVDVLVQVMQFSPIELTGGRPHV